MLTHTDLDVVLQEDWAMHSTPYKFKDGIIGIQIVLDETRLEDYVKGMLYCGYR